MAAAARARRGKNHQGKKPAWFIFACALTLINNFYFAYINLIFIGIYILFRWMIPLEGNEAKRLTQCRIFILSGLLGFGISAVSFIPVVYGYLHNLRPPYSEHIAWLDFSDNILFSSRIIILPAVFLLFLFTFSLYKNRLFRLFAGISLLYILFHFSPFAASAFNGFQLRKTGLNTSCASRLPERLQQGFLSFQTSA